MRVTTHEAPLEDGLVQGLSVPRRQQDGKPRGERNPHDDGIRRVLAANVRRHRLRRRWSVDTLSARSQLTPLFIRQIEQGSAEGVRLGILESLARAFQIDVTGLLISQIQDGRSREGRIRAPKDRLRKRRES